MVNISKLKVPELNNIVHNGAITDSCIRSTKKGQKFPCNVCEKEIIPEGDFEELVLNMLYVGKLKESGNACKNCKKEASIHLLGRLEFTRAMIKSFYL